MTVKIYVRRDERGRELPAAHSHESWGALELIHRIWTAFQDVQMAVAICVSLENPSADLVILTQRGLGVVELKDVPGEVRLEHDGSWYARYHGKFMRISGGKRGGRPRKNPHHQVRDYASVIRQNSERLLNSWLPSDMNLIRFNTAVCFTHPAANIDALRRSHETLHKNRKKDNEKYKWERFQILTPGDVVKWAHALSFEEEQYLGGWHGGEFARTLLSQEQVFTFPIEVFRMSESDEIPNTMLTGEPVAYLTLEENGREAQYFSLYPGENIIGRDRDTKVSIPLRYESVSRHHARILHSFRGTFIQDLDSRYGTYLDGKPVSDIATEMKRLGNSHVITLCRPNSHDEHACVLRFQRPPLDDSPPSTSGMTKL